MARRNSRMGLKVDGVDEIVRALQNAKEEIQKELRDLISECAEIVFREADKRAPILTGTARSSLRIEIGEDRNGRFYANVVIGGESGAGQTGAFYITFYELGTSRQEARPFMRPALQASRRRIRARLIEGLRQVVARQGR